MTTNLAIGVTMKHLEEALSRFFGFLPVSGNVRDHYTQDIDDLVDRVLLKRPPSGPGGAERVMTAGKWWSYYFSRNTITPDVDRPKDVAAKVAAGTAQERYVKVRVLPYSMSSVDYNVVSNDMFLLENLEETILLRKIVLTQEFDVEIENTDFFFKFQYKVLDGSLSYRVSPTQLGSLSVLSMPIEVRYPIISLPEEVKEIRQIKFRIFIKDNQGVPNLYREITID